MPEIVVSFDWNKLTTVESVRDFLTPRATGPVGARDRAASRHREHQSGYSAGYMANVWRVVSSGLSYSTNLVANRVGEYFQSTPNSPLQTARRELAIAHQEAEKRRLYAQLQFGDNFLVHSINAIQESHLQACVRPIVGRPVLQELFKGTPVAITAGKLDQPSGVCLGQSLWLIACVLDFFAQSFQDELDAETVVAMLESEAGKFRKGAPEQATLLAYIWELTALSDHNQDAFLQERPQLQETLGKIADPAKRREKLNTEIAKEILIQKLLHLDLDETLYLNERPTKTNSGSIATLPRGIYFVNVPGHGVAYFKFSQQLGYVFDPNYGLIKFEGINHCAQVQERLNSYNQLEKDRAARYIHLHRVSKADAQPDNWRELFN